MRARELLDLLGRDTLVRLSRERGLAPTRQNDQRRKSLAHSFHGDVEALILSLTRQELVDIFREATFEIRSETVYLASPAKYRLEDLQKFAIRAFAGRPVHIPAAFTAVEVEGDDVQEDEDEESDEESDEDEDAESDDSDDDEDEVDGDDDEGQGDEDDVEADESSAASLLGIDSEEWSRPRMIGRILRILGADEPQRLRTGRFRELIEALREDGIEACNADDPAARVFTASDESPGIATKLRLRLRSTSGASNEDRASRGHTARTASAPQHGGPRIVMQTGETPIPQQVPRPSDYNLAVLRLQFLTAVPSIERGSLPAWPEGYLLAATRGLNLRDQERSLLRAYVVGLCLGNHSPYDAIPRLSQVTSPGDWEDLLGDFEALNPFQPELVRTIIEQVVPVAALRSRPGAWHRSAPPAPDLAPPNPSRPELEPKAASARTAPERKAEDDARANQRDLGALAGMFDDE